MGVLIVVYVSLSSVFCSSNPSALRALPQILEDALEKVYLSLSTLLYCIGLSLVTFPTVCGKTELELYWLMAFIGGGYVSNYLYRFTGWGYGHAG